MFCPFQAKFDVSFGQRQFLNGNTSYEPSISSDSVVVITLSSRTCWAANLRLAVDILTNFLLLQRSNLLGRPDFRQSWTLLVSWIFLAIPHTAPHEIPTFLETAHWLLVFSNSTTHDCFLRETLSMVQY